MGSGVVLDGVLEAMPVVLSCCCAVMGSDGSDTAAHMVPPAVSSSAAEMTNSFFMGWCFVKGVEPTTVSPPNGAYLRMNTYPMPGM
ncbi:hypothetical protein DES53_11418 [Roseimicrobium gellanilyticum]|uniref:Uncharacterized protein n=1 Tax=Roseimicrobium gellanilyticum TaxID=748857 RepID=A0A366H7K0_9BACT|nr:hypothetical protein DES53_11418 [Roseimicrobium gellanilyticum]